MIHKCIRVDKYKMVGDAMRIISCASYYGTGSSAITDLISEYEDCFSLTDYEFKFLQDPHGVRDLEFQLVENHNRHTSGYALKQYKKLVEFLGNKKLKRYEYFFQNQWKTLSYEYINALTEFVYTGYWHQDVIDKGTAFHFRKRLMNKILKMTIWRKKSEVSLNELPNEITYCSYPTEEEFLSYTRDYVEKLFRVANIQNKTNIMVDQIVPPSNLNHYLQYFNDIRVFVVERDPRDLYLLEKYVWKGSVIPTENVEIFCKWFKFTRRHRRFENYDESRVMLVQFEDLVYRYDTTKQRIQRWLGFDETQHCNPFKFFKPLESKKNTQLWKRIPDVHVEMEQILDALSEYIYPFEDCV